MILRGVGFALALLLALPSAASAAGVLCSLDPSASTAAVPIAATAAPSKSAKLGACDGQSITPNRVIQGSFAKKQMGSYVMVPFTVPRGTTAVRAKYCFEKLGGSAGHTIDLGLWDATPGNKPTWGPQQFRGWGGSSHPDVTVSTLGHADEASYVRDPKRQFTGRTTRGFKPGPVKPGIWAVELGVAAVVPKSQGDNDGRVSWRVELELSNKKLDQKFKATPKPYNTTPANSQPGWYAGDFHVHAEHSALGDATMTEAFNYAYRPVAQGGAGLDFITLSDYVTNSAWDEIGDYQPQHKGKLMIRSSEVITYRGHINNQAAGSYVDHRTGPVYLYRAKGEPKLLRRPRPASQVFDAIHASGGFTQINHPRIFPPEVSDQYARLCRGCAWSYSDADTNYAKVDAYEVTTGPAGFEGGTHPAQNPFTADAIKTWDRKLAAGNHIAAVGSSDSHRAGRVSSPATQTPIGKATTVVYAKELSAAGVREAVKAGHTYVKMFGQDRPDLRFEGDSAAGQHAIMGDTIHSSDVILKAKVLGAVTRGAAAKSGPPYELHLIKDGASIRSALVTGDDFDLDIAANGAGIYRLQLQRGQLVEAVTSPIYLQG